MHAPPSKHSTSSATPSMGLTGPSGTSSNHLQCCSPSRSHIRSPSLVHWPSRTPSRTPSSQIRPIQILYFLTTRTLYYGRSEFICVHPKCSDHPSPSHIHTSHHNLPKSTPDSRKMNHRPCTRSIHWICICSVVTCCDFLLFARCHISSQKATSRLYQPVGL